MIWLSKIIKTYFLHHHAGMQTTVNKDADKTFWISQPKLVVINQEFSELAW